MPVQISDPQVWAKSNFYTLRPQEDNRFINVSFQGQPVGLLTKVGDSFEFKTVEQFADKETPQSTSSETELDAAHEMVSRNFGIPGLTPIPLADIATKGANELQLSGKISGTGHSERVLDCNYWLPYAAEHYDISRDIRDYVLVPIPAIFSGLPNTNGDSLPLNEMLAFKPEYGMQMYKTFKGQPTHQEHQNKDITKAKGVILESFLRPVPFNKKYYKIVLLLAFDRTKDSILANQILTGESNAYSVGFAYTSYTCSICNHTVGRGISLTPCQHTKMFRTTYQQSDGRLVFRRCHDAKGFECSAVGTPAFVSAIGPKVLDARAV